jgi:hypothetical protein
MWQIADRSTGTRMMVYAGNACEIIPLLNRYIILSRKNATENTAVFFSRLSLALLDKVTTHIQGHGCVYVTKALLDRFEIRVFGNQRLRQQRLEK